MLNWFARRLKEVQEKDKTGQGGFTLIELLVVVIIIGILAAIAIPTFLSQRTRANDASAQATARNASTAAKTIYTDTGSYATVTPATLDAIESQLPNAANEDPFTTYTASGTTTDFTITVKHKNGAKTYTANQAGITSSP